MSGTLAVATLLAAAFGATYLLPVAARLRHAFAPHRSDLVLDEAALRLVAAAARDNCLRILACDPEHHVPEAVQPALRLEILEPAGPEPVDVQRVSGLVRDGDRVLRVTSPDPAATIAAVALLLRDLTGRRPQIFLPWIERHPVAEFARFLFFGAGEVTLRTREILRRAEPDAAHRPTVHVG